MRALADVLGLLLCVAGLFVAIGSCAVGGGAGGFGFGFGAALMIIGVGIGRVASSKRCPMCSEKVNYKALKCKHCGSALAAPPRSSISEPFYK